MPIAGELTERITLQRLTASADNQGGYASAWAELAKLWAKVQVITGNEAAAADQLAPSSQYQVTIIYRSDITERDRIIWRGRELNVKFIKDTGPSRFLTLMCELQQVT